MLTAVERIIGGLSLAESPASKHVHRLPLPEHLTRSAASPPIDTLDYRKADRLLYLQSTAVERNTKHCEFRASWVTPSYSFSPVEWKYSCNFHNR